MDVKNRDSLKSINGVMSNFKKKNMLPIMSTIKLEGIEDSIPTGAKFGKIQASTGDGVDLAKEDNDTLKDFLELIEFSNGKILDLHHERAKMGTDNDAELVGEILNNDFVEVAE
jgi:hypothetical protein